MKNKKLIIIFSVILLVSIIGNVLAYAAIDLDNANQQIALTAENAPKTKSFSFKNNEKKNLQFKEVETQPTGIKYFNYTDEENSEYQFDKYGNLRFFSRDFRNEKKAVLTIKNKDEAIDAARKFVIENWNYGTKFNEFSVTDCSYDEDYQLYSIMFTKKYGKNGYITGEQCLIRIYNSGEIKSYVFPDVVPSTDFDASSIENLTLQQITDYVVPIIKETYSDDLVSYQIQDIYLVKRNGKYVLNIQAGIEIYDDTLPDGNIVTIAIATEYYYEIDQ